MNGILKLIRILTLFYTNVVLICLWLNMSAFDFLEQHNFFLVYIKTKAKEKSHVTAN